MNRPSLHAGMASRFNRRTVLQGAFGVAMASTLTHCLKTAARARADNEGTPYVGSFDGLTLDEMKLRVRQNIDAFKQAPAEKLIMASELSGMTVPFDRLGTIPAPKFDLTPDVVDTQYFLAKIDNPEKHFPSTYLVDIPTDAVDHDQYVMRNEGIYLGRTMHPVKTEFGTVNSHVIYTGFYLGDPDTENELIRIVTPMWAGFSTGESSASPLEFPITIGSIDNNATPRADEGGAFTPVDEVLSQLDQYTGQAIISIQVGSPLEPSPNIVDRAHTRNWPSDFFTVDFLTAQNETVKKHYNHAMRLSLLKAQQDGYCLYTMEGGDQPVPRAIDSDLTGTAMISTLVKTLDIAKNPLSKRELSADDIVKYPAALQFDVHPTSISIFGGLPTAQTTG